MLIARCLTCMCIDKLKVIKAKSVEMELKVGHYDVTRKIYFKLQMPV